MKPLDWEAFNRALDLIGTPMALESLRALVDGTDPYAGDVDQGTVDTAVTLLRRLGAATPEGNDLAATDWGRTVYHRLVEIERNLDDPRQRPIA